MGPPQIQGTPALPKMGVRARVSNWSKKQDVKDVQAPPRFDSLVPSRVYEPSNKLLENDQDIQSGMERMFQVSDILGSSSKSLVGMKRSNSEVTLSDFGSEDVDPVAINPNTGTTLNRKFESTCSVEWSSSDFLEASRMDQEPSAPPPIPEPVSMPTVVSPSLQAAAQIARGDIFFMPEQDCMDPLAYSPDSSKAHRRKMEMSLLGLLRPQKSNRNEVQQEVRSTLTPHRCFSHYDVQSVLFTAGVPQPELFHSSSEAPDLLPSVRHNELDADTRRGSLVLTHSQFLSETGGDMENSLDLTRSCSSNSINAVHSYSSKTTLGSCTNAAVSVLEACSETQLCSTNLMGNFDFEHLDLGANYYHKYFYNKDHQNYLGFDPKFGPVSLSIRREAVDDRANPINFNYRIILRTSQLSTLRGSVMENSVPSSSKHGTCRGLPLRDVLEFVVPELNIQSLRVASSSPRVSDLLLQLDQQELVLQHRVGLLLCRNRPTAGDPSETSSPALKQFLNLLTHQDPMKGFYKYQEQQKSSDDSTETQSVYTTFREFQLMFHISTLLPAAAADAAQMLSTHLVGNNTVTVIFQEPDAPPFNPQNIRSHFLCVIIVITVHRPCTQHTYYSLAAFRSRGIPPFGPSIRSGWMFPASHAFIDFLLTKIINAKHATLKSKPFLTMATHSRREQLKQLVETFVTSTPLDLPSNARFSFISLAGKKKDRLAPQPLSYLQSAGALTWSVTVRDPSSSAVVACRLAISSELVVLIDEAGRKVVFNCTCRDVIGWSTAHGSVKLFYQNGLHVAFSTRDGRWEDSTEITQRLQLVTQGAAAANVTLRRNRLGQLGFHINFEGVVADVESHSFAWQVGLRPGCRLVEICSVATVTLSHEQMIELLRTATNVTAVVLPPHRDGTPRRSFSETYRLPLLEVKLDSDVTSCTCRAVSPNFQPAAPPTPRVMTSPIKRTNSADMKEGSRSPPHWLIGSDESPDSTQDRTGWTGGVKERKHRPLHVTKASSPTDGDSSSTQQTFGAKSCSSCSNTLSSNSSDGKASCPRLIGLRGVSVDSGVDSTHYPSSVLPQVAGATLVLADVLRKEPAASNSHRTDLSGPGSLARSRCQPITDMFVAKKSNNRASSVLVSSPQNRLTRSKSCDSLLLVSSGRSSQMPVLLQRRHHSVTLPIIRHQPAPLQKAAGRFSSSSLADNKLRSIQKVASRCTALDSDITTSLSGKLSQLEEVLHQLQLELLKEQQDKAALQEQVLNLRQDNLRLQEESQSAAEQIRRFTSWMVRRGSLP
ncbi:signal-induced proliferation-associated 1-like protein 2 [Cyprinodon tularosa]|uniref:signal-induced proliferation-associated 1-like protein 2 n=1 Tax=Cyprinodon tularosa TaxID=77115 RepID=UPI0018E1FC49|nr:signal-induced proliferation-associated 1-like protein 2 [Cyprinodon tularosa]